MAKPYQKKTCQKKSQIRERKQIHDDATNESHYLIIDKNASQDEKIKRMEVVLINYFKKDFGFKFSRSDQNTSIWDNKGRVRIDTTIQEISDVEENATFHAAALTVLYFIYQRAKAKKYDLVHTNTLYHKLPDAKILFSSQNEIDEVILSLVSIQSSNHSFSQTRHFTKKQKCQKC